MNTGQFQRTNSLAGSTRRLPLAIWALGFGSLLMDTSSELVHSLSPVLLVNILGASVVAVGMIEGVAEFSLVEKEFGPIVEAQHRRQTAEHAEMVRTQSSS